MDVPGSFEKGFCTAGVKAGPAQVAASPAVFTPGTALCVSLVWSDPWSWLVLLVALKGS